MARNNGDFWNRADDDAEKKRKDRTGVDTSSKKTDATQVSDTEVKEMDD